MTLKTAQKHDYEYVSMAPAQLFISRKIEIPVSLDYRSPGFSQKVFQ